MTLRNVTIAARQARFMLACAAALVGGMAAAQTGGLVELEVRIAPIEAAAPAGAEVHATAMGSAEPAGAETQATAIDSADLAEIMGPEATGVTEEVIVRGQTPAALRIQIELAEEAVYDRFNEINSSDEFDIHCKEVAFTGSRMLTRFCQPNFWHATEEAIANETVRLLQGSAFSMPTGVFRGEAHYKRQLMREEMERLAREDEEFLDALRHLYSLTIGDETE